MSALPFPDATQEDRLRQIRATMRGDLPVALNAWMMEVERQVLEDRGRAEDGPVSVAEASSLALDPEDFRGVEFDQLTVEQRVTRLRYAAETMASWLAVTGSGFGEHDARGFTNLIRVGST